MSPVALGRPLNLAEGHRETALHARARHHRFVPALYVGEVGQIDLVALMSPGPAENREIGNRHVAAGEFSLAEPPIEHTIEPPRFLRVALESVTTVLFVGDLEKMVHLAGH